MPSSLFARLQKLRIQIEVNCPSPAVILVTSAKHNDGATISAISLAECLAAAGHSVALLGSTLGNAMRHGETQPISLLRVSKELAAGGRAGDAVAALAEKMRQEYDYTIVDAPPLTESSASMRLANIADAVLLSIRLGRLACAEDDATMKALQLAEARVLGVIGVSEVNFAEHGGSERSPAGDEHIARPRLSTRSKSPIGAAQ